MRTLTITNTGKVNAAAEVISGRELFDFNMDRVSQNAWKLYDMQIADHYSWDEVYDSDEALRLFEEELADSLIEQGLARQDFEFTGSIND